MKNSKKLKTIIFIIILFLATYLTFHLATKSKEQKQNHFPQLILTGNRIVNLNIGEKYQESGYQAIDEKDGDITEQVTIQNNIDYTKPGTYEIIYTITNSINNSISEKRFIKLTQSPTPVYKDEYNNIDNTKQSWWSGNKKNNERIKEGAGATEEQLKPYDAYFMGKDEKVIYLTFDEGDNNTYVKEIMEVLNKHNIKATFFFCRRFILDNKELMQELAKTGHSVGNHTANHLNMPSLATKENFHKYIEEITATEKAFKEVTGVDMDKVYREPRGEWSYRSLQIMKDLGYKSFFWSADYLDWNGTVSKEKALTEWMKRYHNGAIYLIHPKNKGNYEAMEDFILKMQELGYTFDLVKNISS